MPEPSAAAPESAALIRALAGHPERMADLIEALHRRAVTTEALLDLLNRICHEAVHLLDGVHYAGITAQFDREPMTLASTDPRVAIVEKCQYAAGDGAALRAVSTGHVAAMDLRQVRRSWPQLAHTAHRAGVRWVLAVPLLIAGRPVAALNLYSSCGSVPPPDPDFLTVLTEYAARGLDDFRFQATPVTTQSLRAAIDEQILVHQAIGILMQVYGFNADYARDVLTDQAQDWHRGLPEHAAYIINTHTRPH